MKALLFEARIWRIAPAEKSKSRVGKGISAKASHRTVREPLDSYGSCHSNHCLKPNCQCANK
ncbi:MAG: hypothetical protein RBR87_10900, partial [Bacteroidales bacterium]|nr:hypothetical protein [Bacteroidales bacterium]